MQENGKVTSKRKSRKGNGKYQERMMSSVRLEKGTNGKINYIAKELKTNNNGIIFFCNSGQTLSGAISIARSIREVQDNPIILIADEFERYARDYESEMKNFLDGIDSIENTLFLAATNYIDKVPETLKNRPSRFRIVSEIKGIEDKETMKSIIKSISDKIEPNLFSFEEIENILKTLETSTFDELKLICLDKITSTFVKVKESRTKIGFKKLETIEEETDYETIEETINQVFYINSSGFQHKISKTDSNI
jgi:SpoVK/Ycf46/Vps4 family AAA+-type ATPase